MSRGLWRARHSTRRAVAVPSAALGAATAPSQLLGALAVFTILSSAWAANLALARTASQSSTWFSGFEANKANDNIITACDNPTNNLIAGTGNAGGDYWMIGATSALLLRLPNDPSAAATCN